MKNFFYKIKTQLQNAKLWVLKKCYRFIWKLENFLLLKKNKITLAALFSSFFFSLQLLYKLKKLYMGIDLKDHADKKKLFMKKLNELYEEKLSLLTSEEFNLELLNLYNSPDYQIIFETVYWYDKPYWYLISCLIVLFLVFLILCDFFCPILVTWYYLIINKFSTEITKSKTYWKPENLNMWYGVDDIYNQKRLQSKYWRTVLFFCSFFVIIFILFFLLIAHLYFYCDVCIGVEKENSKTIHKLITPKIIETEESIADVYYEDRSTASCYEYNELFMFESQYQSQLNNGKYFRRNPNWRPTLKEIYKKIKEIKSRHTTLKEHQIKLKKYKIAIKKCCKNELLNSESGIGQKIMDKYKKENIYTPRSKIAQKEYLKGLDKYAREIEIVPRKDGTISEFIDSVLDNKKKYPNHEQEHPETNLIFKMILRWVKSFAPNKPKKKW